MTALRTAAPETRPGAAAAPSRRPRRPLRRWGGWLFVLPALVFYSVFVLKPLTAAIQYSFYRWNGITVATFVGVGNYVRVLTDPHLLSGIAHAFFLILFFTVLPVAGGLLMAALLREIRAKAFGTLARTVLFLPQIIPGAAAAIAWVWMFSSSGTANQVLSAVGLGGLARAWLGDFTWSLPAVGIIGTWINLGFCMILLLSGIGKIDASIYEAARLDGAGFVRTLLSVTLPGLKQELGVCITVTIISALASFDIIFMSTQGGPGYSTMVPGVLVYQLGFTEAQVGLASALALVLTVLILAVVLPLQRLFRTED
ncbi:MalF-type ABC sugar transport systems permease component [Sinomonas atrocyanea]|uniref:MalF-type ABC sugar transport systems permease component n=1 Tax=Sinomonas atrocyanea TaxID=37927 RepID=A0A126ZZZ9_9MICC|nr:sugar ABC transporter permease [Sinomonas atrocyanea]AMM31965.1 MalF-type ABC sugar transport systems permease component [Sinomonas atrocyanea]GEB65412.1 ABC transporter permease [Sinomonas atrocyanea]GGG66049.1 ABC transporter permease [Sinomonas atrocyanea]